MKRGEEKKFSYLMWVLITIILLFGLFVIVRYLWNMGGS